MSHAIKTRLMQPPTSDKNLMLPKSPDTATKKQQSDWLCTLETTQTRT